MNEDVQVRHRTVLDSETQQAGDVYAKAVFGAAERTGTIDETLDELRALVEEVLARQPKFVAFLESPRIDPSEKRRVVEEAFRGRLRKETLNLLRILADNGRVAALPAIHAAFKKLVQERRREVEVSVVTAEPLTDDLRQLVQTRLAAALGRHVQLNERIQQDLIGGLVVRIGDTVFDASLAGQFERIRGSVLASARSQMREAFDKFSVSS